MENEENYVPYTRKKYNLPDEKTATKVDYSEIFEETPLFAVWRMFIMQILSVRLLSEYILFAKFDFQWLVVLHDVRIFLSFFHSKFKYRRKNAMGNPKYPAGTNHFNPNSPLFKSHERECHLSFLSEISHIFGDRQIHCTDRRFVNTVGRCHVSFRAGLLFAVLFSPMDGMLCQDLFGDCVLIPSHRRCLTIGKFFLNNLKSNRGIKYASTGSSCSLISTTPILRFHITERGSGHLSVVPLPPLTGRCLDGWEDSSSTTSVMITSLIVSRFKVRLTNLIKFPVQISSLRHLSVSVVVPKFEVANIRLDNGPKITKAIKPVLKEAYNYDSTVSIYVASFDRDQLLTSRSVQFSFYALYRSFTQCQFVEEEGDIIFYKNSYGEAVRQVATTKDTECETDKMK